MARPRFGYYGGHVKVYIPKKARDFQLEIGRLARLQYTADPIKEIPLEVQVDFYREFPKNTTLKKQALIKKDKFWPVTRPDVDNYLKLLIDGCNGIIWADDNIIVKVTAIKHYSKHPHCVLRVKEMR